MRKFLLAAVFVLVASSAFAQSASPTDKFAWQITASDLTVAQNYRWDLELDGTVLSTPLTATCQTTTTALLFACTAPIPPITPSQHTARVRAVDTTGGIPLEGQWSDALSFSMRATPNKPISLGIVPGLDN